MKDFILKFTRSPFVRNVAIMATGAAGAQFLTMAASPLITRLYGPEAFGLMGTFTALTQMIIPVAALTYPIAIVLPKNNKDAKGLIKLSLIVSIIISLIVMFALLIFNREIIDLFNIEQIGSFLYLIPVVIIFAGLMQVAEQWLIRTKQFSINAKVNFLQSVIINSSKVGMGFIYPVATVLIILQVFANGLRASMMIFLIRKNLKNKKSFKFGGDRDSIKKNAKKYIDFPIYRSPQVFLGAFSESLPVLLLTTLFGPASAGFYNIGRTVLSMPSKLIGQSIGDVFYPKVSEAANNHENINRLLIKTSFTLVCIGIIPFGIIILFGPSIFDFVFGQGWDTAGEYARWIALSSFAIFVNKPAVRAMPVLSAQRIHLIYTVVFVVTRGLALLIGFFIFNNDVVAVALFGISSFLLNVCLFMLTLHLGHRLNKNS